MENFDDRREEQVWRRVRGEQTGVQLGPDLLQKLILEEMCASAGYLVLSKVSSGRKSARFRTLFMQSHRHGVCLKGICAMVTGKRPIIRGTVPETRKPEEILRQNYGREVRCLEAYEKLSHHPEYGPVFSGLMEECRAHSCQILEILGQS